MSKISYIVLPKQEQRWDARAKLSTRVIANAMRLLIAVILMSALVVIIMLAAHRVVNVQPVQPWTLAPALVPPTLQANPQVAVKRDYILCESENLPEGEFQDSHSTTHCGDQDLFTYRYATYLYKKCAVITLRLDGDKGQNTTLSTTFTSDWEEPLRCLALKNRLEVTPTLAHYKRQLPVYNLDENLFYGTPLLNKWQNLLNIGEDMLDHCVRLMLVWRYGGIACNLEPAERGFHLLRNFKNIMDNRREDVIVEKESARVVYSKRACHSAIGSMLKAFAELPRLECSSADVHEFHNKIMRDAKFQRRYVYLATVEEDRVEISKRPK